MPTLIRTGRASVIIGALVLAAAGCSRDSLLAVQTPDQILPGSAQTPAGAQALWAAAIGNFNNFFGGTTLLGANIYGGLLSDELNNARPGGAHIDQRAFNPNTFPNNAWDNFSQAYTQLIRGRDHLVGYAAAGASRSTQTGQLYALSGLTLTIGAELFCNGVPLSDVNDVKPSWTVVTNAQMYQRAGAQFDSALTTLSSSASDLPLRYLARVGKARALVDLGQYAQAAAVVRANGDGVGSPAVPTSFVYNAEYAQGTLTNDIYDWMVATANFAPANKEGGNGLDFFSAQDPRVVMSTTTRTGQDGVTPVHTVLGYPNGNAPIRLATGVEARMIEAEAALQANDAAGYLGALDAARSDAGARGAWGITSTSPDPLPPLADPGTPNARIDLLFRERGFWFYLTAHRVGDLRRLVRQYGRDPNTVWPTGAYLAGGTYGTDQNITPSIAENNNPGWHGCADRNP